MDLQQYLQALRKFWWVLVVTVLIGGAYGVFNVLQAEPQYRATVTFFVVVNTGDSSASAAVQGDQFAQRRVNSYVALLSTDRLAQQVSGRLGGEVGPGEVRRMMGASGDLDTVLLTATVTTESEELSTKVGEAVAVEFINLVEQIESGGGQESAVHLEVVSGPTVREVGERAVLAVGVPAFVGLLVGLGVVVLLELRDNAAWSEDQVVALTSVPVVGRTPAEPRAMVTPIMMAADAKSPFAESVRQLRTNLQFIAVERPIHVLAVTSSISEEGKSITTANLAVSMAGAGFNTLVIDADLRRPTLAASFGVDTAVGLTDVLAGTGDLDRALRPWDSKLTVLPTGRLPSNPAELLDSDRMKELMAELRERFDIILIDTPPVLPVADALIISGFVEGVLLAVRLGHASRTQISRSAKALQDIGAPLLGMIVTLSDVDPAGGYLRYE